MSTLLGGQLITEISNILTSSALLINHSYLFNFNVHIQTRHHIFSEERINIYRPQSKHGYCEM
jgi:hypothetical protein